MIYLKYPNNIKMNATVTNNTIIYGNRGMDLENDLNLTNNYY